MQLHPPTSPHPQSDVDALRTFFTCTIAKPHLVHHRQLASPMSPSSPRSPRSPTPPRQAPHPPSTLTRHASAEQIKPSDLQYLQDLSFDQLKASFLDGQKSVDFFEQRATYAEQEEAMAAASRAASRDGASIATPPEGSLGAASNAAPGAAPPPHGPCAALLSEAVAQLPNH